MKAPLVFLVALFILTLSAPPSSAQQLSGRVYYKASNQIMIRIDSVEMSPEEIAEANEIMKKPWQRDFILTFTQTESNWRQAETLAGGSDQSGGGEMTISLSGSGNEILYKNLIDQLYVQEQEFMGREFLIQDALEPRNWKLTGESKRIGEYTAQKAIFDQVIDSKRFSTGMEEMEQVKDTVQITVWFTPEIPVAHGPENYFGLPGLILEVQNGGRAFYCEQIELNPTANPIDIQIPKKGKVVSGEEFELMQRESIRQMENRYQGKPGENGKKIRVGG